MEKLLVKKIVLFFAVLFVTLLSQNIFAQEEKSTLTIKIDQIISKDYPNLVFYTIVENDKGEVVSGLSPGIFKFRIDGMEETGKASVVPFSMREAPIDYSVIISNSGIMEGEPLDFQKNAILQFIDSMKPKDTLSLYTIGEEANVIFEEQGKESIDPSIINAIETTTVQPRLYDSVINVVRKAQRRQIERKVILIISDGRDINSRFTKDQLNTVLQEAGLPVYALGIRVLGTQSLSNINEMADLTGGTYIYTAQVSGIPANLRRINGIITQPYIINLKVKSLKADNLPHVLEVNINEFDLAGRGQKTFTAVKVPVPRWVRWVIIISIIIIIAVIVVIWIIRRTAKRKRMGITKRKCPVCKNRMKDSWDSCPFCRYLPKKKKKGTDDG